MKESHLLTTKEFLFLWLGMVRSDLGLGKGSNHRTLRLDSTAFWLFLPFRTDSHMMARGLGCPSGPCSNHVETMQVTM